MKRLLSSTIIYKIFFIISCATIFNGCVKNPQHASKYFKNLKYVPEHTHDYQKKISVRAKQLNVMETERLLSTRAPRLFRGRKKIIPVQLSFSNRGNSGWIISPRSIRLPLFDYQHVYKRLRYHTAARVFSIITGGLLGFGLSSKAIAAASSFLWAGIPGTIAATTLFTVNVCFLLGTPGVTISHGLSCKKVNKLIRKDLKNKMLRRDFVLTPGSHHIKIIFVEQKQLKRPFTISLYNATNKHDTLDFLIDLHEYES